MKLGGERGLPRPHLPPGIHLPQGAWWHRRAEEAPPRDPNEQVVVARGLHKTLGSKVVLDDVSFQAREGETLVVLGRSGTGKSVLLRHITGLMNPDRGSMRVLGSEISELHRTELYALRLQVGVLFQGAALLDSMNVYDNVTLGLRSHTQLPEEELHRIADEKLEAVGLRGIGDMMPSELSGGMRKRVGLARAIAMNPSLILYDEPTTGLDPVMADVINDLILRLGRAPHITSIVVTHDMTSAFKVGTHFVMIHGGHVLFDGDADQLRNCPDPRVAGFIAGRGAALELLR